MNKTELIETLSGRLGDRKAATAALDAVLAEIQNAVTKGDKVSITGFGVFEKRVRAARTARNPRTGESVKVKKTSVPAFRPGVNFKELVAAGKLPKVAKTAAPAKKTAAAPVKTLAAPARKTAAAPVKTLAAPARKTAAPAKASATRAKADQTTAVRKVAAPAKKMARAATSPTPRSTATVRAAAKKAPARANRTAAK
ncbi:MAG: DNA-binding protein HU-beta [Micromonosporaceae bacterium]|nr:DNA-binding protein HU-beta [Micromonosporaceae bacterium]